MGGSRRVAGPVETGSELPHLGLGVPPVVTAGFRPPNKALDDFLIVLEGTLVDFATRTSRFGRGNARFSPSSSSDSSKARWDRASKAGRTATNEDRRSSSSASCSSYVVVERLTVWSIALYSPVLKSSASENTGNGSTVMRDISSVPERSTRAPGRTVVSRTVPSGLNLHIRFLSGEHRFLHEHLHLDMRAQDALLALLGRLGRAEVQRDGGLRVRILDPQRAHDTLRRRLPESGLARSRDHTRANRILRVGEHALNERADFNISCTTC